MAVRAHSRRKRQKISCALASLDTPRLRFARIIIRRIVRCISQSSRTLSQPVEDLFHRIFIRLHCSARRPDSEQVAPSSV